MTVTLFFRMPTNVKILDYKSGAAQRAKLAMLSVYVHRRIDSKTWIIRDTDDSANLIVSKEAHNKNLREKAYFKLVDPVCIKNVIIQTFLLLFILTLLAGL